MCQNFIWNWGYNYGLESRGGGGVAMGTMGMGRSCTVVIKTMQVIINTIFNLFCILISFINDSYTEENCAKRIRDLHNGVQKILIRTAHNVNFTLVSFKDCSVIIVFF